MTPRDTKIQILLFILNKNAFSIKILGHYEMQLLEVVQSNFPKSRFLSGHI